MAEFYDELNSEVPYGEWAEFLHGLIKRYGREDISLVLDLACGTGIITRKLASLGYDMTGVDLSTEMLDIARGEAEKEGQDILWLCQDMRGFELYGTVGAVVCCLDSINYLLGTADLKKCFSLVHNYLDPDGIFIFDVNTAYKFREIYSDNSFILETDRVYCGWQNHFDPKRGICDFWLTMFSEDADGRYIRTEEHQRERYYSERTLKKLLKETGFELLAVGSDFDMNPLKEDSERAFYVAKSLK
ncbi:MAG: class I SAM-dependent methyltransferase [Ruminococcaceae bacterium]|nr:class I SAM-dependent methyltransferase [Oscillospiraceae bacterium]